MKNNDTKSAYQKVIVTILTLSHMILLFGCGGGSGVAGNAGSTGVPSGALSLAWNAPTTNINGTRITDIDGYRIYYGPSPGSYNHVVDIGNATAHTFHNISPATRCFAITAYNKEGIESGYSNELCLTG